MLSNYRCNKQTLFRDLEFLALPRDVRDLLVRLRLQSSRFGRMFTDHYHGEGFGSEFDALGDSVSTKNGAGLHCCCRPVSAALPEAFVSERIQRAVLVKMAELLNEWRRSYAV
jgi:hypothetical protein